MIRVKFLEYLELEKLFLEEKITFEEFLFEYRLISNNQEIKKISPWKSKEWKEKRDYLLKNKCHICGSKEQLIIQHTLQPPSYKMCKELVLTGELNDVGAPLRSNIGDSYRLGLEIDANVSLSNAFKWRPNIALSDNRNIDFYFERDGVLQNLGNTHIAYSPQLIAGNIISYQPNENFQVSLLSKFVGKQYMGNIDSEGSVLDSYTQTDFNIQYTINTNSFVKSIVLSGLVNNIFDADIVSNGYFYTFDDDYSNPGTITTIEGAGYYPQAGINFLLGATVNF